MNEKYLTVDFSEIENLPCSKIIVKKQHFNNFQKLLDYIYLQYLSKIFEPHTYGLKWTFFNNKHQEIEKDSQLSNDIFSKTDYDFLRLIKIEYKIKKHQMLYQLVELCEFVHGKQSKYYVSFISKDFQEKITMINLELLCNVYIRDKEWIIEGLEMIKKHLKENYGLNPDFLNKIEFGLRDLNNIGRINEVGALLIDTSTNNLYAVLLDYNQDTKLFTIKSVTEA